jgi:hypothetical protein
MQLIAKFLVRLCIKTQTGSDSLTRALSVSPIEKKRDVVGPEVRRY